MLSAEGGRHENFIEYLFLSSMRDEVSNHPDTMLCKSMCRASSSQYDMAQSSMWGRTVLHVREYAGVPHSRGISSACVLAPRAACRVPRAACRVRRGRAVRQTARAVHAWKVLRADCRVGGPFAPP